MQVLVECHNKQREVRELLSAVLSAALGCRASLKQGICDDEKLITAKNSYALLGQIRIYLSMDNKILSVKAAQSILDSGCFALGLDLSDTTTTNNNVTTYFYNLDLGISALVQGDLAEQIDLPLSQTPTWGYKIRLFAYANENGLLGYLTIDILSDASFEISALTDKDFILKKTPMTTTTLPVSLYLGEIELTIEQIAAVRNGAAVKIKYGDTNGKLRGMFMTGNNLLRKADIEIQSDNTLLITESEAT